MLDGGPSPLPLFLLSLSVPSEKLDRPVLYFRFLCAESKSVTKLYKLFCVNKPEPEFVNLLRSPGIDSQSGGPVRQPYLTYRPVRLHRLAESTAWNPFMGSLNVFKYGLS
jgi:hypothetical protein